MEAPALLLQSSGKRTACLTFSGESTSDTEGTGLSHCLILAEMNPFGAEDRGTLCSLSRCQVFPFSFRKEVMLTAD